MMNSDYFRRPVSLDPTDIDFLWRNEQKALQDSREQLYSKNCLSNSDNSAPKKTV